MNNVFSGELVALGYLGFSRITASERAAFRKKFGTCGTVYGSVNSAAAEKGVVCGVYNGVTFHFGYIVPYDSKRHSVLLLFMARVLRAQKYLS